MNRISIMRGQFLKIISFLLWKWPTANVANVESVANVANVARVVMKDLYPKPSLFLFKLSSFGFTFQFFPGAETSDQLMQASVTLSLQGWN